MKALIIGGGGFAGRYLIEALLEKTKLEVIATKQKCEKPPDICGVKFYNLDITDYEETLALIARIKPDFVYHLAAQSSAALSWKLPQKTFEINVCGTINILQALKQTAFKGRMIFIGSGEEYGKIIPKCLPISEGCELAPANIYALSKFCGEKLCLLYQETFSLDIICVRAFNHIGAFQSEGFVSSDFAKQIAEIELGICEPVIHVGNLDAVRDFTDVRDVVSAYILLMEKGFSGEVYNVGGGSVCSIKNILDILISLSSALNIKIITDEKKLRPVDVPEYYADISKLVKATEFSHHYELKQSLKSVLDYWRKRVK